MDTFVEGSDEIYTLLAVVHLKNQDIYRRIDILINELVEDEEREDEEIEEAIDEGKIDQGSDINLAREIRNKNKKLLEADIDELMPIEQQEKQVLEGKRLQILKRKRITIF